MSISIADDTFTISIEIFERDVFYFLISEHINNIALVGIQIATYAGLHLLALHSKHIYDDRGEASLQYS